MIGCSLQIGKLAQLQKLSCFHTVFKGNIPSSVSYQHVADVALQRRTISLTEISCLVHEVHEVFYLLVWLFSRCALWVLSLNYGLLAGGWMEG